MHLRGLSFSAAAQLTREDVVWELMSLSSFQSGTLQGIMLRSQSCVVKVPDESVQSC